MNRHSRIRRLAHQLLLTPYVLAAARQVARRERALGFGGLLSELRERPARPLPPWASDPESLAGAVERWLAVLPPRRYGACLRRALVLYELWRRCGLEPTLHLGLRLESAEKDGHAWLSATAADGRRFEVSGPLDTRPLFEF